MSELLSVVDVCRKLGIGRATFYRLPYFRTRRVVISPNRIGFLESDVEAYIHLQSNRAIVRRPRLKKAG